MDEITKCINNHLLFSSTVLIIVLLKICIFFLVLVLTAKSLFQNPMFANNPQLQEQIRTMMPQMLAQLQNPEMQQMMSNPQVS